MMERSASVWQIANAFTKDMKELEEEKLTHLSETLTLILLYLFPKNVDMKQAKTEFVQPPNPPFTNRSSLGSTDFNGLPINLYDRTKRLAELGTMGDPMVATAEKGGILFDWIKGYLMEMIIVFYFFIRKIKSKTKDLMA